MCSFSKINHSFTHLGKLNHEKRDLSNHTRIDHNATAPGLTTTHGSNTKIKHSAREHAPISAQQFWTN